MRRMLGISFTFVVSLCSSLMWAGVAAADVCTYDPAMASVSISVSGVATKQVDNELSVTGGQLTWEGQPCSGATVSNTDTVNVTGTGGNDDFWVDLAGGQLAPGVAAEPDGISEIEIHVNLAGGNDLTGVDGTGGNDTLVLAPDGFRLNGDADTDVLASPDDSWNLHGYGGSDRLTARGVSAFVALFGDGGNDRLLGGRDGDYLWGGPGKDALIGGPGGDRLLGVVGNDILKGGPTADLLIGGPGTDTCYEGPGDGITRACEKPPSA